MAAAPRVLGRPSDVLLLHRAAVVERSDEEGLARRKVRQGREGYDRRAMTSQWAAVGAETDLPRRARQLHMTWERLLAEGGLGPDLPPAATAGLRSTIVESWRRSLATGLDPTDLLAPIEAAQSEVLARWFEHPLGSLTQVLTEQLRMLADESQSMVVVTDASGLVLHRVGDERLKELATAEMNLVEGARYSEAADGTNGIGTALAADHAFQVFGFEHFNERHHEWVCSGAPVHDPVSGQTVGLIDLSSLWKIAHPRSLELVVTAARTIERCLLDARGDRDARLRRRYSDLMTRSTDLLVDGDGYVLEGAELAHPSPFDIPEGGGEVVLGDGSLAVAAPLGRGEAYLLRQGTTRRGKSASAAKGLERAEERARELATEQAALRQVATLVARESSPDQLFAVVAEQVAQIFDVPHVRLVRYEPDGSVVVGGYSEGDHQPFPIGSRWPLNSPGVIDTVRQNGRPARVEDYENVTGEIGAAARGAGMRSAVASPIVVESRLWGAMVVLSPRDEPLPEDTEARLTDLTELVSTAIANTESREALARLANEQDALRRVATLVAQDAAPSDIFAAVSSEVDRVFGLDPATFDVAVVGRFEPGPELVVVGVSKSVQVVPLGSRWPPDELFAPTHVLRTGRSARIRADDLVSARGEIAEFLRHHSYLSQVATPIVVDGRLWGAMSVNSSNDLPPDTEERLEQFTELVATAIANAESRGTLAQLAVEQAALRRVATLVAHGARPNDVFLAVSDEIGRLFGTQLAAVGRYEPDVRGIELVVATQRRERWELARRDADFLAPADVLRTGRSARSDAGRWESEEGETAQRLQSRGIVSTVASPIVVEGELWGAMLVASTEEPLPRDTEERLERFTELVATALANADSRTEVDRLATEQAALRRVATLVAEGAAPAEVFAAVAWEVAQLFDFAAVTLSRYEDDAVVVVADPQDCGFPVGSRWPFDGDSLSVRVHATRRMARIDDYSDIEGSAAARMRERDSRSAVGAPIVVEGSLWGILCVGAAASELLPADIEARIAGFVELVGTAIANSQARDGLRLLADEQAALRHVATLVARGASPHDLFEAVAEEVGRLLPAGSATMGHFEPDGTVTTVASWSTTEAAFQTGRRWPTEGTNVAWMVRQTGESARLDDFSAATDPIGVAARDAGIKSAVGSPILVNGHLWGVMTATSNEGPMPPGTEARLASFTELVATAIANAESTAELAASRRRIVAASDGARRRIERNLHDGVQQELVSLGLKLGAMKAAPPTGDALTEQLASVTEDVRSVFDALVEIARGIHPAILAQGGLAAAVKALGRRSAVQVELHAQIESPLPDAVEVAAYYVAAEALTNTAKHARASAVEMDVTTDDGTLTLMVRDDGVGGADPGGGSGLVGLRDRVEALGGTIEIDSPAGSGTCVVVRLPIAAQPDPIL
jgi:signal transduction histidine kinase